MTCIFTHAGDLGDIVYSLPAIRAAGGGKLILFDHPGKTAHGMTEEKVNRIRPLLECQPYIDSVEWSESIVESSLNGFRHHMQAGSLTDAHLATLGFSWHHRTTPWLTVPTVRNVYDVIIHRSERYHNHNFPWDDAVKQYSGRIGYVGFEAEHRKFCEMFGDVPRVEAGDFLQLAAVIKGAKLFIGNQSSPLAVAHGMFKTLVMEICPGPAQHHCVWQRMNCLIGWDRKIVWPDLEAM